MTIAIFGYVSRDIVSKQHLAETTQKIGGKAYYSGVCLANLGEPTVAFVYTDTQSDDLLQQMSTPNLKIFNFNSSKTPCYENVFLDKSLNKRQFKTKLSSDFCWKESLLTPEMKILLADCSYIHLAPTGLAELPPPFVSYLKQNFSARISADLDFIVKQVDEEGKIKVEDFSLVAKILAHLDLVLISQEDIHLIPGESEQESMYALAKMGPPEIVLTKGSSGAIIYSQAHQQFYILPAVAPKQLVDATGAGDTYIAAYLAKRKNHSIEESGTFAATITSLKLAKTHAYGGQHHQP